MKKIKSLNARTVLEIGSGDGFIQQYMKTLDMKYDTMHIISDSNPTYLSFQQISRTGNIETSIKKNFPGLFTIGKSVERVTLRIK